MSMRWVDAITAVLKSSNEARHYASIAEEIAEKRYREPDELGATPATTVNAILTTSINQLGAESPFVRVESGYYSLKGALVPPPIAQGGEGATIAQDGEVATAPPAGIIHALGMNWLRSKVVWKTAPQLFGKQQLNSKPVDIGKQIGVYFLHDAQGVVYVGRAIEQAIGIRLQQHTSDRLNGRWERFSWFGLYPVLDDGTLKTNIELSSVSVDTVISTLEAVLIEGLEPRQNRRRGDDFKAIEFIQGDDPEIQKARNQALLATLAAHLNT